MLSSCLAICFFRLLHANHHGGLGGGNEDGFGEDLAIVHSQDDFNGDIVIEHRHRPLVHKSYGSGQYVIPAAAIQPAVDQFYQRSEKSEEYFESGGGIDDGQGGALEANADYVEDYSLDDFNQYFAEGLDMVLPSTQGDGTMEMAETDNQAHINHGQDYAMSEYYKHEYEYDPYESYDDMKDPSHEDIEQGNHVEKFGTEFVRNVKEDGRGAGGGSDTKVVKVDKGGQHETKEDSRMQIRKLLRLLIAAYIWSFISIWSILCITYIVQYMDTICNCHIPKMHLKLSTARAKSMFFCSVGQKMKYQRGEWIEFFGVGSELTEDKLIPRGAQDRDLSCQRAPILKLWSLFHPAMSGDRRQTHCELIDGTSQDSAATISYQTSSKNILAMVFSSLPANMEHGWS